MKKPVEVEQKPLPRTLSHRIAGQVMLWFAVGMVVAIAASIGAAAVRWGFGLA